MDYIKKIGDELTIKHEKTAYFEAVFVHNSDKKKSNLLISNLNNFYDFFEEKNL